MSGKERALTLNSSSRSVGITSLIDGAAHFFSSHRIWLHPLEHRNEKKKRKQASDPTGGIPCRAPSKMVKTNMKLKQANHKLTETINYIPRPTSFLCHLRLSTPRRRASDWPDALEAALKQWVREEWF
jgi:hypothetical protein